MKKWILLSVLLLAYPGLLGMEQDLGQQLYESIVKKDAEKTEELLAHGANPNWARLDGFTVLMAAAEVGNELAIRALLNKGAHVNTQAAGLENISALSQAAQNGHTCIVQLLLDQGAHVNIQRADGHTPLMIASTLGYYDIVKKLLDKGARVNSNAPDEVINTAIMGAAEHGFLNIVELLIQCGADVNLPNYTGFTPLMMAAQNGHFQVVEALLKHGALINARAAGAMNVSALIQAVTKGHTAVVRLLLAHGAEVNVQNAEGVTPLSLAADQGFDQIVSLLLENHADINIQAEGAGNTTALMQAVQNGHINIVRLLLQYRADRGLAKVNGISALMIAAQKGRRDLCEMLLTTLSSVDMQTIRDSFVGFMAINRMRLAREGSSNYWKVEQSHMPIVHSTSDKLKTARSLVIKRVIDQYVDDYWMRALEMLEIQNDDGLSAFEFAQISNHFELAQYLNPNKMASRQLIRDQIRSNIKAILKFKKRERTRELTEQDAFGAWDQEEDNQQ